MFRLPANNNGGGGNNNPMDDPNLRAQCCPDPDNAVIPDEGECKTMRQKLHCLYYAQYPYMILKVLVLGSPMVLLF